MKIVIAGGSGFLGRPLAAALTAEGHDLVNLSRRAAAAGAGRSRSVGWNPDGSSGPWAAEIEGAGAVVNLAGESIAGKRWSEEQKRRILDSRVRATRSLVAAIQAVRSPPPVLISGSAVGYYGPRGDEKIPEDTPPGTDFLANVCVQWEAEAARAATGATRVVCVRTGIVLERDGGALPQMLPPFRFGAGGPVGTGRQYWPWIHRADWIALVQWAIRSPAVIGPINATAPNPVTNAEFAKALGRAMHRPAFMPAPGFALKLMLGEMAEGLLLSGQRAVPEQPEQLGFAFRYPRLEEALAHLFSHT
jgi:uncharacterized protein (TIGR01777 family)